MKKILGIDLGTNSLGWAVVGTEDDLTFNLLEKGVRIFQEGVKIEKGMEKSRAAERTAYRSARRIKFRRKLRKIQTLRVLSSAGFCPELTEQELSAWRYEKKYPENEAFREWLRTDDESKKNPYYFRKLVVESKLDLSVESNRHKLGRAFYHLAQRRGFLSNRLESTKESDGAVKAGMEELDSLMGDGTLGQLFYSYYEKGMKIRKHYTHRIRHYVAEFDRICSFQGLDQELHDRLYKAIFYQRPLKSQKGSVGKCPFEKNKQRCPVSHPLFEEYRMRCFINNIKIRTNTEEELRSLTTEEKVRIEPLFYRKSKAHFDFSDICKKLTPKGNAFFYYKDQARKGNDFLFNYPMNTSVSGSPFTAALIDIFGEEWQEELHSRNSLAEAESKERSEEETVGMLWHALFSFDSEEKLIQFLFKHFQFTEEEIQKLIAIRLKQDYASLSLKAIRKILPFLREGLIYSHAVYLGKLDEILPADIWNKPEDRAFITREICTLISSQNEEKELAELVNGMIKAAKEENAGWVDHPVVIDELHQTIRNKCEEAFRGRWNKMGDAERSDLMNRIFSMYKMAMQKNLGRGEFIKIRRTDERIKDFLRDNFNTDEKRLAMLYHPSAIEVYKEAVVAADGRRYLGSPMISSIRNPMAMRALHQLRKVINALLKEDLIDEDTVIHIEMARDLNDANQRKAIQRWQRDKEKKREEYRDKISDHYKACGSPLEPSETDILKYQLYEEQGHICLYTGETIGIHQFLGGSPDYDIEHTIPRSVSYDNSQVNKTLCNSRYNRDVKRNQLPSQLPQYNDIFQRIEPWLEKVDELDAQIQAAVRQAKSATDKEAKDRAIQKRHYLTQERDYWWDKYRRFTMKEVKEGFKNSQLVDTRIMTKYGRMYLKTVFEKVFTVKGTAVADMRVNWDLQGIYEKKERNNHIHHCLDAITMACMTREVYDGLARYYHDLRQWEKNEGEARPSYPKPWKTFTEDLLALDGEVLVSHYTPDRLNRQMKRKIRQRGYIRYNNEGTPLIQQGNTVRGSLHQAKFYGAIEREVINKKGEKEKKVFFVIRDSVDKLKETDVKNIVDNVVKAKVEKAIAEKGFKVAMAEPIWMNEAKGIAIKKVRYFTPSVTSPIHLKPHRDTSVKEYKRDYYVVNDENYIMGIYEGVNKYEKVIRDFVLLNNLDASRIKHDRGTLDLLPYIHPETGLKLTGSIKTGDLVLLQEKDSDIINSIDPKALHSRLYKIVGLSSMIIQNKYSYGVIILRFHAEARPTTELKLVGGEFKYSEYGNTFRKLLHTQFNGLIENKDFLCDPLGRITLIREGE
ncbi:MAG: type II CRISPR RNA-guided endonuclease Cas9 [Bacteroidota bacterium]